MRLFAEGQMLSVLQHVSLCRLTVMHNWLLVAQPDAVFQLKTNYQQLQILFGA